MTPQDLLDALGAWLETLTKSLLLPSKSGERRPSIFTGDLPYLKQATRDDSGAQYPFVVAATDKGNYPVAANEAATVDTTFVIGCFDESEDRQGYRDALSLAMMIIGALKRDGGIGSEGRRFRLDPGSKIQWEIPRDQPYPYWLAQLNATFLLPNPVEEPKRSVQL